MKETETDTGNKTTAEDKDMKRKEAQALKRKNIPDLIETDKINEDPMTTDTDTHKEGIKMTIKKKDKEIDRPEEAEAEKKVHININLTKETDMKKIHLENRAIATKDNIPEVPETLEAQEERMIEREKIPGQKTEREKIPDPKTGREEIRDLKIEKGEIRDLKTEKGEIRDLKIKKEGTPDPPLLKECPSKKDIPKETSLRIPLIETTNTKDTRILM
jgi:hypothetical protein